uniref:Uncharacterized protein n=1 Tax=Fagus sylvatica TaxID=28930 RepID=A0A2N9FEI5_FAGSY
MGRGCSQAGVVLLFSMDMGGSSAQRAWVDVLWWDWRHSKLGVIHIETLSSKPPQQLSKTLSDNSQPLSKTHPHESTPTLDDYLQESIPEAPHDQSHVDTARNT